MRDEIPSCIQDPAGDEGSVGPPRMAAAPACRVLVLLKSTADEGLARDADPGVQLPHEHEPLILGVELDFFPAGVAGAVEPGDRRLHEDAAIEGRVEDHSAAELGVHESALQEIAVRPGTTPQPAALEPHLGQFRRLERPALEVRVDEGDVLDGLEPGRQPGEVDPIERLVREPLAPAGLTNRLDFRVLPSKSVEVLDVAVE